MKVVQINTTCGIGSTGKICVGISRVMTAAGIENYILCTRTNGYSLGIPCSDSWYIRKQALRSKILGNYGFNSRKATARMIAELERIQPDIVHLHNIHGHDCNLEILFSWFRRNRTKLVWTFHDCWAFTAYCPHFSMAKCYKWKSQCGDCIHHREYSWFFDQSRELFERKKILFTGLDLTIVAPSHWLAGQVKQSLLKEYPVNVIYNGIDLDIFKPELSDFRKKHHLEDKKIIVGVAFCWDERKGIDVFVELSKRLPENYRVVLIGTDEQIDKQLPENVISIHRTQNQQELVKIYSAADVFVNPTREEVLGLVNIEALACSVPGVTFESGGSPECFDENCGSVVPRDDVDALEKEIIRICTEKPYSEAACLKKAGEFDQNERFKEYLKLYERVISAGN